MRGPVPDEIAVGHVQLDLVVDGEHRSALVDTRSLLIDALRDVFGATGPKIGCLTGDCGACTVRANGMILKSCLRLAVAHQGSKIETIASLAEGDRLSDLQEAFWDLNAFQCGFCLSGMLLAAEDLRQRNPVPDDEQIRAALLGNLCRCTGYNAIVAAVRSCVSRSE
jgi:aerobic-type carbon monoxide dehydrogenase small subunit (CoxS/CutS family)